MKTTYIKKNINRSNPTPSPKERVGVRLCAFLFCFLLFAACEKDGDKIYLSGLEESDFMVTETDVILSKETSSEIVLSVAWKNNTLVVSNPNMSAPNVFAAYVQLSTQEDFASHIIEVQGENESKAYTGAELNAMAKNLGLEPDVATPVYFRLRGSMGSNVESVYSEVKKVNITPYFLDMTVGNILNSKKEATGITLSSPDANGIYTGFIGATSWFNFYLEEGDGLLWGNDDVTGTPFVMTSAESRWNLWYPAPGGCYYTEINTVRKNWSATYLPALSVSGSIAGEMTFDRPNNRWYYVFDATSAGSATIQLSGQGDLYNVETGTEAPASNKVNIAFAQDGNNLTLASTAGQITVHVPATGECTLIIDLSDPKAWTCRIVSGSEEPEVVIEEIYLPGIDDGITGTWSFDNMLKLYDEENKVYNGILNVNSKWGYQIAIENENWEEIYTQADGDAYAGTLVFQGSDNITPPDPGLYFFNVSLKNLTFALTPIGNTIYVTGLDDDWSLDKELTATGTPGVYSGSITFAGASPWGFQIVLNTSWSVTYGGADGKLVYGGNNNIKDDATLTPGTYTMTVDFINGTYSIQ